MGEADYTEVYRATTYRVEGPDGNIDVRIGAPNPVLDALLRTLAVKEWAFITAWNPHSRPASADANSRAQHQLMQELREHGLLFFEGEGIPDNSGWAAERSVWIAGIGRREAAALGARFGQNAVLAGMVGEPAELVYCAAAADGLPPLETLNQ
jgi:hypothetical protein